MRQTKNDTRPRLRSARSHAPEAARVEASRPAVALDAHAGWPARAGGPRARRARAALAKVLWSKTGERRLPGEAELDGALSALNERDLAWICELSPLAPLYFLPTRRFIQQLVRKFDDLGVRKVLEVAAGDGFLTRALRKAWPRGEVTATDSGAWQAPSARMSRREQRELAAVSVPGLRLGADVQRCEARRAVRTFAPELVLCAWLPPSHLLDGLVRADVRYVLEIGAGSGVTASAYSWRFAHEFLEGPLERAARCRLDLRPARALHSRVTLYYGAQHPEHFEERVRPGDWLHQFRPARRR